MVEGDRSAASQEKIKRENKIMVSKKMFHSIDELQKVQLLATQCIDEVGLQSSDGSVSVDAKSFIGMYALDFTQPIWVCCDDPSFHKKIRNIGENID